MKQTLMFSALAAAFGMAALPGMLAAQEKKPLELRYTSGAPPKGNPWAMQIERFAKDVDEESKGALKIQPFLASQLGSEQDTVQQVGRGRIDMGGFSGGAAALIVPEVALLQMPFFFKNTTEQDCVLDGMVKPVTEAFASKGVQFLGYTEVGTIDLMGKKPFPSPKDLNGVKAAAYANKVNTMFWSAMGANPNPLGLPEWIPAFQTGLADVVATPITYALPSGLTKVANVATRLAVWDAPGYSLINKAVYDKLSKDHQAALNRAADRNPAAKMRAEIRGFENVLYGMHEKAGGQTVTVTAEQRAEWRKILEPVYPKMVKEVSAASEKFFGLMQAGLKTCQK